jgi:membrane-associated phospholipid phosphatase
MSIAFRAALPTPTWREAGKKVHDGFAALWPRSNRLAWMIMATCGAFAVVLILALGFDYPPPTLVARILIISSLAALLAGAGWLRPALMLEAFALSLSAILFVPSLTSICAAMAMPLQDATLAAIDRWMGIDWVAMAFWFRAHPELSRFLCDAYASILWQPLLLIGLLGLADPERLRRMMTAQAITLAATIVGFFLVPALGPYAHFGFTRADFPDALNISPWIQPGLIEALRDGSRKIVFEGIVSFPSYHAATSILYAFGWLGVPIIGVPLVLLNVVMLISTVPIGGHYIVDVIAGVTIALTSIRLSNLYFAKMDTLPALQTWDRTSEGRRLMAVMAGWPVVGALIRRPFNASPEEHAAAT